MSIAILWKIYTASKIFSIMGMMANDALAQRVKSTLLKLRLSLTEMADRAGLDYVTVWKMSKGRTVSVETLSKFARAAGEPSHEWIRLGRSELVPALSPYPEHVSEASDPYAPLPSMVYLPVAGALSAGSVVNPEEEQGEVFPALAEHAALADYVVRIRGWSMAPELKPGDFVAIRKARTAEAGEIVVAQRGDERLLKRYQGRKGKHITLTSDNPEYPTIEGDDIEIIGIFAWSHRTADTARKVGR